MLCNCRTKKRSGFQETEAKSCESNKIPKTKHACIVEVHESTRQRLESFLPKDHEDHTATILCASSFPCRKREKFWMQKAAVDKEWEKLETIPAWQLAKLKSEREVIREAEKQKQSPLCYIDGHLSSQKC